jgi:hypothetical protein
VLSTDGLDERGGRGTPSNSLLSRALIRLRKVGLRNMMRIGGTESSNPPPSSSESSANPISRSMASGDSSDRIVRVRISEASNTAALNLAGADEPHEVLLDAQLSGPAP